MTHQRPTTHTATLRALGQSVAVTIPQAVAISARLHAGDKVNFEIDAGRLVMAKETRRKYTLRDLLTMQGNKPLQIDSQWDAMPDVGREVAP